MENLIVIYILFGVAHWSAHILNCKNCSELVIGNLNFLLEGITRALGWPVFAVMYLRDIFTKPKQEHANMAQALRELKNSLGGGIIDISVTREENESEESFQTRLSTAIHTQVKEQLSQRSKEL